MSGIHALWHECTNARPVSPQKPTQNFPKTLLRTQNIKWETTPPNDNRTMAHGTMSTRSSSTLSSAYTAVSKMFFLFAVLAPLMNTNTETISKLLHTQGQRWEIALQVARAAKLKLLQWSSFVLYPS